jgi:predicted amidohydrolase YtcJ
MQASLIALALCSLPAMAAAAPELVLLNARVYTMDDARSRASAVAIEDGRIVYVGDDEGARALAGATTRMVDLGGNMLLPAFQDPHSHFVASGTAMSGCVVFDLPDAAAVLAAIRACVAADPQAEIIRGEGWTMDLFSDGPPRKELLDAIDSTRPLVFGDADGHALWVNSKALATYGISADTADPPGGMIAREPDSGAPRGTLHEASAMELVTEQWPPYTDEDITTGIATATGYYHSIGITAVNESIVKLEGRSAYRSLPALAALNDAGQLAMRLSASLAWTSDAGREQLDTFKAARDKYSHGRLRVDTVKFWADGVVETRTAMLLEPYSDAPETRGLMMIPQEELMWAVPAVAQAGFQAHIHTIGDATARYALDALEVVAGDEAARKDRHYLTHVQFVHPDDIPRFKALGVTANFQPLWAYEDEYITELTRPRVGPTRIHWTYPMAAIANTGARLAFGSDWAVSSANPLEGMEVAITRSDPYEDGMPAFLPEQAVSLEQAIAAYTRDAAYLNALDSVSGTIEVGKYADLVVLDHDLFAIAPQQLSEVKVTATLLEGEVVYGALP